MVRLEGYFAPSVYLGWISAATVISLALALSQLGLEFAPDTAILHRYGTEWEGTYGSGRLYLSLRQDNVYTLTVAWALVGRWPIEQRDAALIFWGACAVCGRSLVGLSSLGTVAGGRAGSFFYAW